jgi:hypothetical protein
LRRRIIAEPGVVAAVQRHVSDRTADLASFALQMQRQRSACRRPVGPRRLGVGGVRPRRRRREVESRRRRLDARLVRRLERRRVGVRLEVGALRLGDPRLLVRQRRGRHRGRQRRGRDVVRTDRSPNLKQINTY